MTSYNRINGPYAADSEWLLQSVVRDEWGFDGAFISDWYGLHSTAEGVNAGLDLEMPGPTLHRGQKLIDAVNNGDVSADVVRTRARNVLHLMERTGALDAPPGPEGSRDDAQDHATLRRASAAGMVLLQNNNAVLPLVPTGIKTIAVLGPNASTATVMGGGSAHVTPTRVSHPLDALMNRLQPLGISVEHSAGCNINKKLPELDIRNLRDVHMDYFNDVEQMDNPSAGLVTHWEDASQTSVSVLACPQCLRRTCRANGLSVLNQLQHRASSLMAPLSSTTLTSLLAVPSSEWVSQRPLSRLL